MTKSHCDHEAERRELIKALQICLSSADRLGLHIVGIYLSSAIDFLSKEVADKDYQPESTVEER